MSPPVCPRCDSATYVRRGVPGLRPTSWSCRRCRFRIGDFWLAVATSRLMEEVDRITREAA